MALLVEAEDRSRRLPSFGQRRLVGRRRELDALARELGAGERLITLVGPPGVGKTRLALEAALDAERRAGIRSLWASLGGHTAASLVVATVAGLLGVSAAAREPAARVGEVLAGQAALLLVLDDVDGVAAGLGPLVARWLAQAPALRVLVTSRMRLGLDEERVIEVGPLPVEDAVELFELRARAARRDRGASAPTPPDVARSLCERLDCLPLAIELAAARTSILPPRKLLARLDQRLDDVLRAADPEGAGRGRHASLAAAIEVSWQLLGDAERAVLGRSATFAGSFSLEAAEAVVPGGEALDALASLCERSLIERVEVGTEGSDVRFQLYASVRAFALARLAPDERADAEARADVHIVHECERLLRELEGPLARAAEERLELEREQLVATERRAEGRDPAVSALAGLALSELSALRGVSSTAPHEIAVRAARAAGDPALLARSLLSFAAAAARLGYNDEPRRALDEAVALAEARGGGEILARALLARGRYRAQHGAFDDADADLSRAALLLEAIDAPYVAGCVRNVQGCVAEIRGELAPAAAAFEAARASFRRAGSERMEAAVLNNLGVVRQAEGRGEDARRLFEDALERAIASGNRVIEADAHMNLGSFHLGEGDLDRADDHSRLALDLQRRLGNRRFEGLARMNLALAAHARGELRVAEGRYQEALAILRECGEARFVTMGLPFAAAAEAALGRLVEARADFEAARQGPAGMDPGYTTVIDTLEAFLLLAEARGADPALREEAERRAAERLVTARARRREGASTSRRPELSLAIRLLERAVGGAADAVSAAIARPPEGTGPVLRIGSGERWFSLDGGDRVDLSRRGPLRLLVRALVEQRKDAPGVGVGPDRLFAAGWPGQRALPRAAASRVYTAIATLRRLGLDAVLQRQDDGYLLDPALAIEKGAG